MRLIPTIDWVEREPSLRVKLRRAKKYMSQKQFLKSIEMEIQRINKIIDQKIIRGEDYWKEARDHKLLLKKIRFHERRSFFRRLFPTFLAV